MNATKSILLIEDDQVFSQLLSRALIRFGFSVEVANNSQVALELCSQFKPDYVVLDLKLGEESGLRLIRPLLDINNPRILVLTGYASIATAVEATRLGAHNYLQKPTDAQSIVDALTQDPAYDDLEIAATPLSVERMEWEHIQKVLAEHQGNISATARALGMHRRTLQRKLAKKPVKR